MKSPDLSYAKLLKMNMPFYRHPRPPAAALQDRAPPGEAKGASGDYDAISLYCTEKAASWEAPNPEPAADMKENAESASANRDIYDLVSKTQALTASSKRSNTAKKVGTPPKGRVFRDKKNGAGKRSPKESTENKRTAGGTHKKDSLGKMLHKKIAQSEELIAELQRELRRKDGELDDLEDFASNLQELLRRVASGEGVNQLEVLLRLPDGTKTKGAGHALWAILSEKEEKAERLAEKVSNQGSVIHSLKDIIEQKDQAIEDMSYYAETDARANKKILAHVEEKHQAAMKETQERHAEEVNNLTSNVASQSILIMDLKNLLCEKDAALAEMATYNEMNDLANQKLLAHANERHEEELRQHKLRMQTLRTVLSLQMREKFLVRREMELLRLQMDEIDARARDAEDAEFAAVALAAATAVVALLSLL